MVDTHESSSKEQTLCVRVEVHSTCLDASEWIATSKDPPSERVWNGSAGEGQTKATGGFLSRFFPDAFTCCKCWRHAIASWSN